MELWEGKIVVVGGENMDYPVRSPRLPQTGETVQGDLFQEAPDGKGGNQGGDAFDPVMRAFYKAFGVCRIRLLAYGVTCWQDRIFQFPLAERTSCNRHCH